MLVLWCACMLLAAAGATTGQLRVLQPVARTAFYVAIAAPPSAAAAVRAFNRSIAEISNTYLAGDYPLHLRNITLLPLYIELPEDERFSAALLERTCEALEGKRVASLLVCGGGPAASAVVSAATRAGVPVLRTSMSHLHFSYSMANDLLPLEVRLEITVRETLHAIRSTLLHTHWHTFTLLSEENIHSTLSLRKDLSSILSEPPLNPKWLSLPTRTSKQPLFRRLAEISKLTRGVVVLICDVTYAKLVMDEAKRHNMLDGHFFWLWVDATKNIDIFSNISNTNLYDENINLDQSDDKKFKVFVDENIERYKRYDVDNKTAAKSNLDVKNTHTLTKVNATEQFSYYNKRSQTNDDVVHTHISNDESLSSSSNGQSKTLNIDNLENIVNMKTKGVESSKTAHKMVNDNTFPSTRSNVRINNLNRYGMKRETQNKYVNSIDIEEIRNDGAIKSKAYSFNDNYDNLRELLFPNEDSEIFMNPKVQTSNRKIELQKRKEQNVMKSHRSFVSNEELSMENVTDMFNSMPIGLLALKPMVLKIDRSLAQAAVRLAVGALRRVLRACDAWSAQAQFFSDAVASCWQEPSDAATDFSMEYVREMRLSAASALAGGTERPEKALTASFTLLNLVSSPEGGNTWRPVGRILGRSVTLHTITWPGGKLVAHGQTVGNRTRFRIVTALAPPFVMEGELDEDDQCLRGLYCHRPETSDKDNLTLVFNELPREDEEPIDYFFPTPKPTTYTKITTHCCYGLAMDLLENIAKELEFDFHLYIVEDGLYGSRKLMKPYRLKDYTKIAHDNIDGRSYRALYPKYIDEVLDEQEEYIEDEDDDELHKWNGIVGDLVSGAAHMSFAALSVSSARSEVIDYSQPFFFSEISKLAAPNQKQDIPLLAFLLPFSPELWIAIFTSLNLTAIAVAIYEWFSPFGLNPWGRQRSKNFSISSALWVMWGLLCGHLVAFKAPKSWPNKFLINVWGGFSVIFVASYTANIAALIAGLFFHNAVDDFEGRSNLLSLRVGTARSSVSEYYIQRRTPHLAQHMQKYAFQDVEEGVQRLRNGTLDLLIADTPILDYYRATDHGCKLQRGITITETSYAIGMSKGFPLKDSISAVIAKYSSNGYMDILTEKWYGGLPCFKLSQDYGIQPKPLGVAAVAGVFILLGVGMIVGCLILILEHLFYKYTLPVLRHKPKGTIWRSPNIMFFSQKLYRFINCVELVSPQHSVRELVNTVRQGQFMSLFQKSVKRKEHEQRRRRRSRAQLFEMIQQITRAQRGNHALDAIQEHATVEGSEDSEDATESKFLSVSPEPSSKSPRQGRSPRQSRSPRGKKKRCSLAGLNVRRFSTDSVLGSDSGSIYERTSLNIGRRLSRDVLTSSPPDINSRLRTPSPMVRRPEGSSTRSYQDVTEHSDHTGNERTNAHASVEILISHHDVPPIPPFPRAASSGREAVVPEDELIRLWRNTGRDVQEAVLAALMENRTRRAPDQDPG